MKRERELEQALEACLAALRSGSTREEVLESYRELREELKPLLELVEAMPRAATASPSERFRTAARARLMAAARNPAPDSQVSLWGLISPQRMRWVSSLAAALLAVVLVSGVGVSASAEALPGELLYPVKRVAERAELTFAPSEQVRQNLQLRLIDRRVQEAERLAQRGQAERANESLAAYAEGVEALGVGVGPSVHPEQAAELAERLRERLENHQVRLQRVVEDAPPPARPALEQTLERSRRGLERAAEVHELHAARSDGEVAPGGAGQPSQKPQTPAHRSEKLSPKGKVEHEGSDAARDKRGQPLDRPDQKQPGVKPKPR